MHFKRMLYCAALSLLVFNFLQCRKYAPDEKNCTELFYHVTRITAEDREISPELKKMILKGMLGEERPDAYIAECMRSKNSHQIRCEMEAEAFSDLKECSLFMRTENSSRQPSAP